jgi:hypothetical protein
LDRVEGLGSGDPARDLAAAWVLLPTDTASRFFDTYAHADETAIQLTRRLAAIKSLFLMLMGQNGDRAFPAAVRTGDLQAKRHVIVS